MIYAAVYVALVAVALFTVKGLGRETKRADAEGAARARVRRELRTIGPCGYRGHAEACRCDRGDAAVIHVRRREGDT